MKIKEKLQKGNVEFTVKGQTEYGRVKDTDEFDYIPKVFKVAHNGDSINTGWQGMNVNKWGPTCVTLYTFDMLGRKSVGRINYKNIEICQ